MNRNIARLAVPLLCVLLLTGCVAAPPTSGPNSSPSPSASATADPVESIENTWSAPGSVTLDALPLGDGNLSTETAAVGSVLSCRPANPNAPGAQVEGPWINGDTWNAQEKIVVQGEVSWPMAAMSEDVAGTTRTITTNGLPIGYVTGVFPVAATDPAIDFDRNPNAISESLEYTFSLPITPADSATPNCVGTGAIGVLLNGVVLFSAVDVRGDDAVAHETQDVCQGHPEMTGTYHYHEVPTCLRDNAAGTSTVVGWAVDGYPIVVERDAAGFLPTNADLDACHGRTSPILLDGEVVEQYHYSATLEYPYTVGCLKAPATEVQ